LTTARIRRQGFYIVIDDNAILAPDALIDSLLATFQSPTYEPPTLPGTIHELLALSRENEVEFARVVSLLERDSVVASQVLRKAQAAFYAGRRPIKTLHEAIVRLGLSTLRDMFMAVIFKNQVFRAPGYEAPMQTLQQHSTAVAYVARKVCERTGHAADAQHAFLCGLLHDIGMAMSMLVLAAPARTGRGSGGEAQASPPAFDKVLPAILRVHEPAGGILGHLWRLPPEVILVISSHHKLPPVRDNAMAAAVATADWIATELGYGVAGERDSRPLDAVRLLGLSDVALADIQAQVRGILARVL
jgi:putative nucleotidyltransferase with HDIG domain